jgi:hypothetical protein
LFIAVCLLLTGLANTGLSGCHGIGELHNNKTTLAIIGHFRTFPTVSVFCFSIPKKKMFAKFTLP